MFMYVLVFIAGALIGAAVNSAIREQKKKKSLAEFDAEFERQQNERREARKHRYEKDKTFKRLFYQGIDEFLMPCNYLVDMQQGIEYLIGLSEQIDGKDVYQPMKGWETLQYDLKIFLYGLMHWKAIKGILLERGTVRSVEIIKELGLDKPQADTFFYILANIGVLAKEKDGRYNTYRLVSEELDADCLKAGWPELFGEFGRLPIND